MGKITVVALGAGEPGKLTLEAIELMEKAPCVIARTMRHGAIPYLQGRGIVFESLDDLYDQSEDFDQLNRLAAEELIKKAEQTDLVYAVPGAADPTDETLRELCARGAISYTAAGVSPDACMMADVLCQSTVTENTSRWQRVTAGEIGDFEPDVTGGLVVVELQDKLTAGEVKIRLLEYYPDEHNVFLSYHDQTQMIQLYELDYEDQIDHTSTLYVPPIAELEKLTRYGFKQLCQVMEVLRGPGGCPWDAEQTHHSIEPYLVEEAYEALDAIKREDVDAMIEELGDLILQVIYHTSIGTQYGEFTERDVISSVCQKMIYRHPHVFPANRGTKNWEELKAQEKGFTMASDSMEDVPRAMPSLLRMQKLQKKSGIFNDVDACIERLDDAIYRLQDGQDALTRVLFCLCDLARKKDINLEMELDEICNRMCRIHRKMEENNGSVDANALVRKIFA